jgi:hypothetical protein
MKNGRLTNLVVLLVLATVTFTVSASAQKSSAPAQKYVACWAANLNAGAHISDDMSTAGGPSVLVPQKKYYSGIFTATATAAKQAAIQNAFTGYLLHTYPNDNTGPGRCGFYGSEDAAQGWLNTAHTDDNSNNRQIFDTGWVYGAVASGSWVVCQATINCGGGQTCYYVSKMFHAPEVIPPLSDEPKYSRPFADWLSQRYPNLDHNAAFGPENGGLPDHLVGSLYCEGANTQQLAQKAFNEYIDPTPPPPGYTKNMNKYQPVPWPSGK